MSIGNLAITENPIYKLVRYLIIAAGIGIYMIALKSSGTHNMDYYILWTSSFIHGKLFDLYHVSEATKAITSTNFTVPYTPFSLYIIGLFTKILFIFVQENSLNYIIAINLTCTLFTIGTFFLLRKLAITHKIISPYFYLFSPTVILATPILGYQDSIMTFFILLTIFFVERQRIILSGIFGSLAIMSKQLALMPILAVVIILFLRINHKKKGVFSLAFFLTTTTVLSPFIISGHAIEYFRAQALTSIHTMLSAGAANFPWLFSICVRIVRNGLSAGMINGGSLFVLEPQILRQIVYISLGIFCFSLFILWIKRELSSKIELNYFKAACVMLLSYYLFSAEVHENHIFSILTLSFMLTNSRKQIVIYGLLSAATFANLLINYGFGRSLGNLGQIANSNHLIYQFIIILCFIIYLGSFLKIYQKSEK